MAAGTLTGEMTRDSSRPIRHGSTLAKQSNHYSRLPGWLPGPSSGGTYHQADPPVECAARIQWSDHRTVLDRIQIAAAAALAALDAASVCATGAPVERD